MGACEDTRFSPAAGPREGTGLAQLPHVTGGGEFLCLAVTGARRRPRACLLFNVDFLKYCPKKRMRS